MTASTLALLALAAVPAPPPPVVTLHLGDGSHMAGRLVGGNATWLALWVEDRPRLEPLAAIRRVELASRCREAVPPRAGTGAEVLVRCDGAVVAGRLVGIDPTAARWLAADGSREDIPLAAVARIDLAPRPPPAEALALDPTQEATTPAELVAHLAGRARHLARRLATTAHHEDPPEQRAIAALDQVTARAAALLALAIAPGGSDGAGNGELPPALAELAAAAADVDLALERLAAYDSIRRDWSALRSHLLPEIEERLRLPR